MILCWTQAEPSESFPDFSSMLELFTVTKGQCHEQMSLWVTLACAVVDRSANLSQNIQIYK